MAEHMTENSTFGVTEISQPPVIKPPVVTPPQLEQVESDTPPSDGAGSKRSWPFRCMDWCQKITAAIFGWISIVFLLALTANIPILQFLSFGYLLETTGRMARGQKFRTAFIGLKKATRIGKAILGAWLLLIPIRFASQFWLEAYLIDPNSSQTTALRIVQIGLMVGTIAHITVAWFCGSRLRYFFWPIVAPFSFAIWFARRFANNRLFRGVLTLTIGSFSQRVVDDICNAQPISDWFLPAVFIKKLREGRSYQKSRDGVWEFFSSMRISHYFWLGFNGFIGTCLWLLVPTALLVMSTNLSEVPAALAGLAGTFLAIPIFSLLPFVQAHFATDGKLIRFFEPRVVLRNVGRAPFVHTIALLLALVLAVPLFLLKIEEIPTELLWSLSLVFIAFTLPAKLITGWAYYRGTRRERPRRWWVRYPIYLLAAAISFSFVFVLFFTRYITWNGAWSLVENHVFLLPAPFWLSLFNS